MIELNSTSLVLEIYPERGGWSLHPAGAEVPCLESVGMRLLCSRAGRPVELLRGAWQVEAVDGPQEIRVAGSPVKGMTLRMRADANGQRVSVEFVLPGDQPLLFWRVGLENQGNMPVQVEQIELLRAGTDGEGGLRLSNAPMRPAFYAHGWQSWSYTGVYGPQDRQQRSFLGPVQTPMIANPGTPLPGTRGVFGSDLFGVLADRASQTGIVAGFLAQREHFGSLRADLRANLQLRMWANGDAVRVDPGEAMTTDWAALQFIHLDAPAPLDGYLNAAGRENGVQPGISAEIPAGWCSWYEFYQKIDQEKIRANLERVAALREQLPLKLVQIDDGFESQVGDWYTFSPGFPQGVAPLAAEIRSAGLTPGLWLAPFIVHPDAKLVHQHPEWLLCGPSGRFTNAGFVWNRFTRALDLTAPGALDFACGVVATAAHQWGFPYLKLDFLYAGALPGRRADPTRTRARVLRESLEALRRAAGMETYLLGCGAPLGSSIGVFNAMRVSADVSGDWTPRYFNLEAPFSHEPHMPCARNALQNILARAPLHLRWWVNDPDCLIVRPTARLTLAEVRTLASAIALTGGSLLLSDNLPMLPEERLRIARLLLPAIGLRPVQPGWMEQAEVDRLRLDLEGPAGAWYLLAHFNWQDHPVEWNLDPVEFGLPGGDYLAHSFWEPTDVLAGGGPLPAGTIAAHGVALYAMRRLQPGQAQFAGSDLHISQGLEVAGWEPLPDRLRVTFSLPRTAEGTVTLRLPAPPAEVSLDAVPCPWQNWAQGIHVPVAFNRSASLEIRYKPNDAAQLID